MKIGLKTAIICVIGVHFLLWTLYSWAADITHYVQNGDDLFQRGKIERAAEEYNAGFVLESDNYALLWRMARCCGRLSVTAGNKKDMLDYTLKEEKFARKAISVSPESFEGYLYLAESLGKLLSYAPFNRVFKYIIEIREAAEKAIELNPKEAKPYLILGMWHRDVAKASWFQKALIRTFFGKLPQADVATSISLLEKAVELDNARVKYHYELAMGYDAIGNYQSAAQELKKTIKCKPKHQWDEKVIVSARKLLKESRYAYR